MPKSPTTSTRKILLAAIAVAAVVAAVLGWRAWTRFPPDTSVEGAYARIVVAVTNGRPRDCFAYLETQAQWGAYTIRDDRKKAYDRVAAAYPEPERTRLLDAYRAAAMAPDGADVFVQIAEERGFIPRLRRDLSGIRSLTYAADRATVETARGARYTFRRRENGIWGLTLFTAELVAEAQKAARDLEVVSRAADDYDHATKSPRSP